MFSIEKFVHSNFDDYVEYGNPYSDLRVDCPFCVKRGNGEDTGHHLYISVDKQAVHCFRCGYKRSWLQFVMDAKQCTYLAALSMLYAPPSLKTFEDRIDRLRAVDEVKPPLVHTLPEDFELLENCPHNATYKPYMKYLMRRGFDPTYWRRYQLGVANKSHMYRVIIPIEYDYWQGRTIVGWMEPRYLNPKSEHEDVLFNSKALELYDEVVVCEGAFSAMAVGNNAIAILGKEGTDAKIKRLVRSNVSRFILTVEPDAFTSISKIANALRYGGKEVTVWKFEYGDPADHSPYIAMHYDLKHEVMMKLHQ